MTCNRVHTDSQKRLSIFLAGHLIGTVQITTEGASPHEQNALDINKSLKWVTDRMPGGCKPCLSTWKTAQKYTNLVCPLQQPERNKKKRKSNNRRGKCYDLSPSIACLLKVGHGDNWKLSVADPSSRLLHKCNQTHTVKEPTFLLQLWIISIWKAAEC